MPRKTIAVYSGALTSTSALIPRLRDSFHAVAIKQPDAAQLRNPATLDENTLAFFLPGIVGEDSPYSRELGKQGNDAIRRYVEDGGVFVGVCAGAYYACSEIVYDPPWRRTPKTRKPGLDLFNALAKGPLPGLAMPGEDHWFSDCRITRVSYTDDKGRTKTTGVAYGNGPTLLPFDAADDIEVLARYADVPGNPIAVAVKKVGKGLAIFLGVLPYIGYDARLTKSGHPALLQLMENLEPHEAGRSELWNMVVARIKQHNADLGRVTLYRNPVEPA